MQQRRDYDRDDDEPQIVHVPETPRLRRAACGRQVGRSIEIRA
jgi:hypothetical protein